MKILVVCTGNICRSPAGEGVLQKKLQDAGLEHIQVESAGTTGFHNGEPPDTRSIHISHKRGYDISNQIARKVEEQDFHEYDLMLAMDQGHLSELERRMPKKAKAKLALFLEHGGIEDVKEVPDPYYGDETDFEYMLDLIESASEQIVEKLK